MHTHTHTPHRTAHHTAHHTTSLLADRRALCLLVGCLCVKAVELDAGKVVLQIPPWSVSVLKVARA